MRTAMNDAKKTKKYIKINRVQMLSNGVFYHGHLQGYLILISLFLSVFTTWSLLYIALALMIPNVIYYLEILIGRAKFAEGKIVKKRQMYSFSVYNIKEEDNLCYVYDIILKDGKKKKVLGYDRTFKTTFNNKVKLKKHAVEFKCIYYYLPISRIIVDIDYKSYHK